MKHVSIILLILAMQLFPHCEPIPNEKYDYTPKGKRSKSNISRIYRRNKPALKYAHNHRLKENPTMPNGSIKIWIGIAQAGNIIECHLAHSSLNDSLFEHTLVEKVKRWHFGMIQYEGDTTWTMLDFTFINDHSY